MPEDVQDFYHKTEHTGTLLAGFELLVGREKQITLK